MVTFSIGDVHGAADRLQVLVQRCLGYANDARSRFVFLGDYVDRGLDSERAVDFLIDLRRSHHDVICLTGNHEQLMLDAHGESLKEYTWLRNGGDATLRSYDVPCAADLPRAHIAFLDSLPLSYQDQHRFFVHAGVHPDRPLDAQDPQDLVWIRKPFLTSTRDFGPLIVHGHSPTVDRRPDQRPNRLNLDTGAVMGGPLTAAIFSDHQREPVGFIEA